MHINSCCGENYHISYFTFSGADIIALIAGAALLSVGATFMCLNNFTSAYWYLSMTGVIIGGLIFIGGIASVSKKSFFSNANGSYSSTDPILYNSLPSHSLPQANFSVYAPVVRPLFIKQSQLTFSSVEEEHECKQKLENFAKWYHENQYIFSSIKEDAQADQFHKLMVAALFEVTCAIDKLPANFNEEKLAVKKEFIKNCSEHFLGAFEESTKTMERKAKKEPFEACMRNIFLCLTSKFSRNVPELMFIVDEFKRRWQLVLIAFS